MISIRKSFLTRFFKIFKMNRVSQRDFWLLLYWKKCKQRHIHSPRRASDVQTPSKLSHDATHKLDIIWKWNFARVLFYETLCLKLNSNLDRTPWRIKDWKRKILFNSRFSFTYDDCFLCIPVNAEHISKLWTWSEY